MKIKQLFQRSVSLSTLALIVGMPIKQELAAKANQQNPEILSQILSQNSVADYTEAIRLNPDDATPKPFIRLNPEFVAAYNSRGIAYRKQGNLDEAIRINPEFADAYNNRGNAYRQQGNKREALENFRKAGELYEQQENPEGHQNALARIRELE